MRFKTLTSVKALHRQMSLLTLDYHPNDNNFKKMLNLSLNLVANSFKTTLLSINYCNLERNVHNYS